MLQRSVVTLDAQIALSDPQLGFPVGRVVAGWRRSCSRSDISSGSPDAPTSLSGGAALAARGGTARPAAAERSADAKSRRTRADGVRPAWQRHRPDRRSRARVVGRRNPARPAVFGEHQRPRIGTVAVGFQHHRQPAAAAVGDPDDVAAAQRGQRVVGRLAALRARRPRLRPLPLRDPLPQPGIVEDRSVVAAEFGGDLVEQSTARSMPRTRPTTERSAWYWANECSSNRCACSGPIRFTRLIVMLYDGANELRSGNVRVEASPATSAGSAVSSWGSQITTAWPSTSMPRRPARPVSCVYSPGSAAGAARR
ncbi:putative ATP-dependent helicase domain protein [Mycobacterium xenopi 3993]|nr:putative ATP-dependent helicase domain protein [Mycobacterium xenopi 3993]